MTDFRKPRLHLRKKLSDGVPFWELPPSGVDAAWLYYNLDRYDLTKLNEATGVPSISRDWLYRIAFFDPGADLRIEISKILRAVDFTIQTVEGLISKYQEIKAGLMQGLFERGPDEDGKLRPSREDAPQYYSLSPLGWIPKQWEFRNSILFVYSSIESLTTEARPRGRRSKESLRSKLIDSANHARGWTEDLIRCDETVGAIEIVNGGHVTKPRRRSRVPGGT